MKTDDAKTHYQRALALEAQKKCPIEEYSRGLAIAPAVWAYQNRGWAYFRKKHFARAVDDWNESGDEYALPRGRAKLEVGDFAGAIVDLELALKEEEDPETRHYLERAYAGRGIPMPKSKARPTEAVARIELPSRKKGETYDAFVDRALATFRAATRQAIDAIRRPAFVLSTAKAPPRARGSSRVGGTPDLPSGTKWPRAGGRPMSFVAQLRLDDLAKVAKTSLPTRGLLSFFVAEDSGAYLEKCAVLLVDTAKLVAAEPPSDFERLAHGKLTKRGYAPRAVTFRVERQLPSRSNPITKKVRWDEGEEDRYDALIEATLTFETHQVLGYRARAYDAEQKSTTVLLLQCFSDRDMSWGDEDHLYVYISEKDLVAGAFGKAFSCSGE